MKKSVLISTMLVAAHWGEAQAGGLWLNQFGDFASGRSSAGTTAGTDDAAAIIHNPSAGTRIEGKQLFGSAGALIPKIEFDLEYTNPINGNDSGGEAGLSAPVASFAYTSDMGGDDWSLGIYSAGLAGAGLEYNQEWAGRFQTTDVEILLLALAPTVGYRVSDNFSIGASLQYYYSTLELNLALPALPGREAGSGGVDGSDTGFGYTLGAVYEFSDRTRLGFRYQSELEIDYDGKLRVSSERINERVESNTNLTMAALLRVGLHHDLSDRWGVGITLGWDDWSALDNVFVSLPEREAGLEKNNAYRGHDCKDGEATNTP